MNSSTPVVSVVMPTLNCKEYLSKTIESVLGQTFLDFEFIIVDDNSTDGTREIIGNFASKDSRVVLVDGDRKGIGGALNKGCKLAQGKYIARIDADDICQPNRLQEEVDYLESHNDVVLVNSDYFVIDECGNKQGRNYPCSWASVIKKLLSLNMNPIAHPTCMFKRDIYNKTSGYPFTPSHEDLILWRELISYGNVGTIKHPLILHRMIGTTLSRKYIGNPYEKILKAIVNKIIKEKGQVQDDILLYKNIMKKASALAAPSKYEEETTLGEIIYRKFGRFLPDKLSESLIIFLKNTYLYFQFSCWKLD